MANTVSSRKRQFYVTSETTFATAVAPTNSDCVLMEKMDIEPVQGEIQRPDLTGDDGELIGMPGRRSCNWSCSLSMAGSGVAGTPPDMKKLLEAALGALGVVVASTSVTYSLGNLLKTLGVWSFVTSPSTGTHQAAISAIVNQVKITIGGDVPMIEFSGEAFWGPDNDEFGDANMDAVAKGGLAAFPAIPTTPTVNGTPPPGFKMTASLDGTAYSAFRTATITIVFNRELPKDAIGGYPAAPADSIRSITVDFGVYDDDSAALISLKQKAKNKTAVQLIFTLGTIAGNRWAITMKNVMLGIQKFDVSGKRRAVTFNGSRAHDSSVGAADAISIAIT